eukprot:m.99425 g.99425  ORF g.99425 m.99425 type:complete len:100 (-) comp13674_c0_seq11:2999-3298(-)
MSNNVQANGAAGLAKFLESPKCGLKTLVLSGAFIKLGINHNNEDAIILGTRLGDDGAAELARGIAGMKITNAPEKVSQAVSCRIPDLGNFRLASESDWR